MLAKYLNSWRDWGLTERPQLLKTFTDGENHLTGLIQSSGRDYVLKVFSHSFDQAIGAQQWASTAVLAPLIIYAKDNVAVFEYESDNRNHDQNQPIKSADIKKLSAALTELHERPFVSVEHLGNFDLLAFCDRYLINANALTMNWHQALMPALEIFVNDPTPWCFCHNDLVKENYLIQPLRVLFIDWEFAQRHNPWFDVAAVLHYLALDKNQSTMLLEHYRDGWQCKMQDPIFYASQIAVLWTDLLWHLSRNGMDYRSENEYRFKQLSELAAKLDIILPND